MDTINLESDKQLIQWQKTDGDEVAPAHKLAAYIEASL